MKGWFLVAAFIMTALSSQSSHALFAWRVYFRMGEGYFQPVAHFFLIVRQLTAEAVVHSDQPPAPIHLESVSIPITSNQLIAQEQILRNSKGVAKRAFKVKESGSLPSPSAQQVDNPFSGSGPTTPAGSSSLSSPTTFSEASSVDASSPGASPSSSLWKQFLTLGLRTRRSGSQAESREGVESSCREPSEGLISRATSKDTVHQEVEVHHILGGSRWVQTCSQSRDSGGEIIEPDSSRQIADSVTQLEFLLALIHEVFEEKPDSDDRFMEIYREVRARFPEQMSDLDALFGTSCRHDIHLYYSQSSHTVGLIISDPANDMQWVVGPVPNTVDINNLDTLEPLNNDFYQAIQHHFSAASASSTQAHATAASYHYVPESAIQHQSTGSLMVSGPELEEAPTTGELEDLDGEEVDSGVDEDAGPEPSEHLGSQHDHGHQSQQSRRPRPREFIYLPFKSSSSRTSIAAGRSSQPSSQPSHQTAGSSYEESPHGQYITVPGHSHSAAAHGLHSRGYELMTPESEARPRPTSYENLGRQSEGLPPFRQYRPNYENRRITGSLSRNQRADAYENTQPRQTAETSAGASGGINSYSVVLGEGETIEIHDLDNLSDSELQQLHPYFISGLLPPDIAVKVQKALSARYEWVVIDRPDDSASHRRDDDDEDDKAGGLSGGASRTRASQRPYQYDVPRTAEGESRNYAGNNNGPTDAAAMVNPSMVFEFNPLGTASMDFLPLFFLPVISSQN